MMMTMTIMMCLCVVTDYWEIVAYPISNIEKILNDSSTSRAEELQDRKVNDVSLESLYNQKVILINEGKER